MLKKHIDIDDIGRRICGADTFYENMKRQKEGRQSDVGRKRVL